MGRSIFVGIFGTVGKSGYGLVVPNSHNAAQLQNDTANVHLNIVEIHFSGTECVERLLWQVITHTCNHGMKYETFVHNSDW